MLALFLTSKKPQNITLFVYEKKDKVSFLKTSSGQYWEPIKGTPTNFTPVYIKCYHYSETKSHYHNIFYFE
jgi:hypothetical protein